MPVWKESLKNLDIATILARANQDVEAAALDFALENEFTRRERYLAASIKWRRPVTKTIVIIDMDRV